MKICPFQPDVCVVSAGSSAGLEEGFLLPTSRRGETSTEELAPLMLKYLLAVNSAARNKKLKPK